RGLAQRLQLLPALGPVAAREAPRIVPGARAVAALGGILALAETTAIIVEIAVKRFDRAALDQPQPVGDQLDKVPVVADQHDRAGIFFERGDKRLAGLHVEWVGRP